MIQYVKSNLKYRITSCPERLFVNAHTLDSILDVYAHEEGMRSFDDWCPAYR